MSRFNKPIVSRPKCQRHDIHKFLSKGAWICTTCMLADGIINIHRMLEIEAEAVRYCAYQNCDGPFTPTEDVRQRYCSKACSQNAKNNRGSRAAKREQNRLEHRQQLEAEQMLLSQQGETPKQIIIDELHVWNDDLQREINSAAKWDQLNSIWSHSAVHHKTKKDIENQKESPTTRASWYAEYDIRQDCIVAGMLQERPNQHMRLNQAVHDRVRHAAQKDLEMILEFAEKLTTINFEWYQLLIMYNYFYEHHRKEATT